MNALILSRLVLAYLARVALGASAADIASTLFELESDIQSALDGMLIPQGYAELQPASSPAIYTITPSGAAALLNAPNPGDVSPELQPSIDIVFSEGVNPDATFLPLFAEIVRVDRLKRHSSAELVGIALTRLAVHSSRRPTENPVRRWGVRFAAELPHLQERGLPYYHAWAFATTRQLGASMELLAAHLRWLAGERSSASLTTAADEFQRLSESAKTFILKAARAVNSRKPLDASAMFDEMAGSWERGQDALASGVAALGT